MTEQEWLACEAPRPMLRFLLGTAEPRVQDVEAFPDCKGSDRKLRLFACACYWRIRHLLPNPLARQAVELSERVADGDAPAERLGEVETHLRRPLEALEARWRASRGAVRARLLPTHDGLALALQTVRPEAAKAAYYASSNAHPAFAAISNPGAALHDSELGFSQATEEEAQASLLRCIFGHLFHAGSVAPSVLAWDGGTVIKLARVAYAERVMPEGTLDWARLVVLADALEEAGCTDAEFLAHLRSPGPHVRGCWVLDLLLGKS